MRNARVEHILALIDAALIDVGSGAPSPTHPTHPGRDVLTAGGFSIR